MEISLCKPGVHGIIYDTTTVNGAEDVAKVASKTSYALATFQDNVRQKAKVIQAPMFALDYDDGTPTLAEAMELFRPYQHVILTTKSHQKEKETKGGTVKPPVDRFRVILFLDSPLTSDADYKATWESLNAQFPGIDKQTKDVSRFYFPGEVVSVNVAGSLAKSAKAAPKKEQKVKENKHAAAAGKGALSQATKDFLWSGKDVREWHNNLVKATFDAVEQKYTMNEWIGELERMTHPNWYGHLTEGDLYTISDIFGRGGSYETRYRFPRTTVDEEGRTQVQKKHPDNMEYLITTIMGAKLEYDEIKNFARWNGRAIMDSDEAEIRNMAREWNLNDNNNFVSDVVQRVALKNRFNSFKSYVESAKWDGEDHIAKLFQTIALDPDQEENKMIYDEFLRRWCIGIVAKIYSPGSQNLTLTLKGAQGQGKSRWLQKLLPIDGLVGEGSIDPENKDHILRHLSYVIWHVSELDGTTRRKDVSLLKDYLTKSDIAARPSYGRYDRIGKSILSFCASVNNDTFLVDDTGNRRFLIIPTLHVDAEHTVNVQQVWAQALDLYKQKSPHWFNHQEIKVIEELNRDYKVETLTDTLISRVVEGPVWTSNVDLWKALNNHAEPSPHDLTKMGMLLAQKGIKRSRKEINGTKVTGYYAHVEGAAGTTTQRVFELAARVSN